MPVENYGVTTPENKKSAQTAALSHASISVAAGLLLGKVLINYGFTYDETAILVAAAGTIGAYVLTWYRKKYSHE